MKAKNLANFIFEITDFEKCGVRNLPIGGRD